MSKPRILVLDDDPHLSEALNLWFGKRNYEIEKATDGEEGLLILRTEETIELLLTDFMMPGLNGLELLKLVKSTTDLSHIKVLVMSHNEKPEFRERAFQLGAIDYLSKGDGAKSIVERTIQVLDGCPAANVPAAVSEIRGLSESLLNLIRVTTLAEGLSPSAQAALLSAQKLTQRIHAIASVA